jgi:uncharacterized protein YndB with AHSA1/START domain
MEMSSITRSIRIPAPLQQVWQALTIPEHIHQWFMPSLPFASLKLDDYGKITVHLGEMGVDFIILEAVEPLKQLTLRSLPDKVVSTTFTLEDEQDDTTVTITMAGFDGLVGDATIDHVAQSGAAWEKTLQNLQAVIVGNELPFPQALVGPLFGYWRDDRKKASIERSIWIAAPRERVWRAITNPKQLQEWYSPNTPWELSALEVGGRLYVYDAETESEKHVEIIKVLNPPHQFATRILPEAPDTVEKEKIYTLTELDGGTRLTLFLTGYEQEPHDSRANRMEENAFGFGMMLQNTKAYLEGEELPFPWGF